MYIGADVQVSVSRFRSFDAAYEGSVLRVYVKALYIAMYIRTYVPAGFRHFPHKSAWNSYLDFFHVEPCGKSKRVRVDICVHLHQKIEEFIRKM